MSVQSTHNSNILTIDKQKENEKNIIQSNQSQNFNYNDSNYIHKSQAMLNGNTVYPYPICVHNERDPLDDFKLKIIKARNKGSDIFLKNYLKFNFSKSDVSNTNNINSNFSINKNISVIKENIFNNDNNLFITEDKNNKKASRSTSNLSGITRKDQAINAFPQKNYKKIMRRSESEKFDPYSQKAINRYKTLKIIEMEKRSHQFKKRHIAALQRIALHNFSRMSMSDSHFVNGSIPIGNPDESYILETKKRKKLPGIKDYIFSKLRRMKDNEVNTPEYYLEKHRKKEKNKLPEIIDIKNSGRFQFHVFHDIYGFKKELDKREPRVLKMTREKIRDLRIMAKINKLDDPVLVETYRRVIYDY